MGNELTVQNKGGLKDLLEQAKASFAEVIPKSLTPEKIIKMVLVAASRNPKLFECTKNSLMMAAMTSAQLGLDCSGVLGSAYLVPFYNKKIKAMEAIFIPGYRGLIDLARRSGKISNISAHCIHKNDKYEVEFGLDPKLVHKPELEKDPGKVIAGYSIAVLTDGTKQVEVMTLAQLEKIHNISKAKSFGPWVDHTEEMYRKTVVKRLMKYLPLSAEASEAIETDNRVLGNDYGSVDVPSGNRIEDIKSKLKSKQIGAANVTDAEVVPRTFGSPAEELFDLISINGTASAKLTKDRLKALLQDEYPEATPTVEPNEVDIKTWMDGDPVGAENVLAAARKKYNPE